MFLRQPFKIFISYASEDRDDIVKQLAEGLMEKYEIWYDQFSLSIGDSLRKKIDQGLSTCDFGIVILSENFFKKNWPQMELSALLSREASGKKTVLPIWHKITRDQVTQFSPLLADRLAVTSELTIPDIIKEIEKAIKSEYGDPHFKSNLNEIRVSNNLDEAIFPTQDRVLLSQVLKRRLPISVIELLTDIGKVQLSDERPERPKIISMVLARNRNMSSDEIDDYLLLAIRLLKKHELLVTRHDSGGYPYWNVTPQGISVINEFKDK